MKNIIIIVSICLIIVIGFLYFFYYKTQQIQQAVKKDIQETIIDKIYTALARIKSIDPNSNLIIASVFMSKQTSSFDKDFKLTAVSKTQNQPATKDFQLIPNKELFDDSLFDKIKPDDIIFIETKENILDAQSASLNLTAIQILTIK